MAIGPVREEPYRAREGTSLGQYQVLARVGQGGMGEAYRGWDDRLGKPVAVKVLRPSLASDPRARRRFIQEARLACRLSHPYIATVFDVIDSDGQICLVMEFIEGKTLNRVLAEDHPLPGTVLGFGVEIVEALKAIHDAGLVHRDLKPSNIMVTDAGHVKVMDFGVARVLESRRGMTGPDGETESTVTATDEGVRVGTLSYTSPEQLRGERGDYRSDLFSFGIVLYEAISGAHPFRRETAYSTASAILHERPGGGPEPRTLTDSGPVRDVVFRLLEKNTDARYPTAAATLSGLKDAVEGRAPGYCPHPAVQRNVRRRRALIWGALALGLSGGSLLLKALLHPPPVGAREGIIVLPFEGPEIGVQADVEGSMLASMLRADFSQSGLLRVIGSTRTEELLGGPSPGAAHSAELRRRLFDSTAVRFVVSGHYEREAESLQATVEIYDMASPNKVEAVRVHGASSAALVDELTSTIPSKTSLFTRGQIEKDAQRASGAAGSSSREALLAAERGRLAMKDGALAEAERHYGEAVSRDPSFVRAHMGRARALWEAG